MSVGYPANDGATVDINIAVPFARNAVERPDAVALRYEGTNVSYAELHRRAYRLAVVLAENGVAAGDRVAFLGLNSPSFLVTLLAAFQLRAIFVPVNFRLAGPELAGVLHRSGATALVAEELHRLDVDAVRATTRLTLCLLVDDDPAIPAAITATPGWLRLSALPTPLAEPTVARGSVDDPAILMFTSGTTGTPKGVTLTHGNIWWNSVNVDLRMDTRRDDVTYAAAPLFHIGALNSFVLRTLARGGTVVLRRSFDPATFARDLVDFEVNSTFAVPSMLGALARVPGFFDVDLSSLRSVVVAGAPVPPSLVQQYADHGVWLQQAWGLTETAPFATHLPVEKTLDKIGSAGTAMPHTEVRIVDVHTNRPVDAGVPGEIIVRGPNVTPGYWENPDATQAAFDDDGWFHSGDIGYLDADGYLYIVDRLKDMIITGGENVYPAEVERALADLAGLVDVAVVGAADPQWGETIVAVMSVSPGSTITLDDVRAHCGARLARYKLPRRVITVDVVPRNASGKLDKGIVRAMTGGS